MAIDGNDADRADDPIHKLLLGRDPIEGGRLASQPTISRFERTAAPRMLRAMSDALADRVLARHRRRRRGARLITIDLDVTEDETHGAQQLTFFNGFYDHWCYLPLVASLDVRHGRCRRDPPPGQRGGDGWRGGAAEAAAPETLARLSPRPAPRAAGWRLRYAGDF